MCLYFFFIICACFQIQSSKLRKESQKFSCYLYLFESLKHLLPLREVSEEELEGAGHEGRVVVHAQVEQNPEESFALRSRPNQGLHCPHCKVVSSFLLFLYLYRIVAYTVD